MSDKFDQWCLLEIMGHQMYAGRVTEDVFGGASFVRVDVPECDGQAAFTKFFGVASIYSITPISQEIALAMVRRLRKRPVDVYDLPQEMLQHRRPLELWHVSNDDIGVDRYDDEDEDEDD